MKRNGRRGATLLEILFVAAASSVLVAGLAGYFRTIRQASDLSQERQAVLQNSRVALDRIARQLRSAVEITTISAPDDLVGSISMTDADGTVHVFALDSATTKLSYGTNRATDLLAVGIEKAYFEGYDADGAVPETEPERIKSVQITMACSVPYCAEAATFTRRVYLRRTNFTGTFARTEMSYAGEYTQIGPKGLTNWANAFGEPDGQYAVSGKNTAGGFYGFEATEHTGRIYRIFAGAYLRGSDVPKYQTVWYGNSAIATHHFDTADATALADGAWWWIDITEDAGGPPQWSDMDLPLLMVEVGGQAIMQIDATAVLAFYDPPVTRTLWVGRQGDTVAEPNQWLDPENAFGAPDGTHATALWDGVASQQLYETTAPLNASDIFRVRVIIKGYVEPPYVNDSLECRTALPGQSWGDTPAHELASLAPYVGEMNEGNIIFDVTNDCAWTWAMLGTRQIRIKADPQGSPEDGELKVDAVGWEVLSVGESNEGPKGIAGWSEQ